MKRVIVTGDDFGLAQPVNEAVELAHRDGILTTTSLMVNAPHAADAIERARRLPSLRVGLHLVLVEGRPVLPAEQIPALAGPDGQFSNRPARAGFSFFFKPGIRRQLEAEIEAQFQEFSETGLKLDHVNAHNHMHLHPTVLRLILKVGRHHGLAAVRIPREPPFRSWRASQGKSLVSRLAKWLYLCPWNALMRGKLRIQGISSNDQIFGLHDSGFMNAELLLRILPELPDGVTEIYFHPATRRSRETDETMSHYQHREEFRTLINPLVREAFDNLGLLRIGFSDI